MENDKSLFTTLDLYLAAYLHMRDHAFTLQNRGGRIVFAFQVSQSLNSLINDYNSNSPAGVTDFAAAVKSVKGMMLMEKNKKIGSVR